MSPFRAAWTGDPAFLFEDDPAANNITDVNVAERAVQFSRIVLGRTTLFRGERLLLLVSVRH